MTGVQTCALPISRSLEVFEMISCELFGDLEFRFDEGIRFLDILEVGYYLIQN